jgi:hypothetical protein
MDLNNADLPTAFSVYVNEFIADGGDPTWRARGYGRWVEHVESWTTTALPFPVLVVRYEDMLQDAQPAAERIAWFLKLPKTADEIKQAVEASTFARMRAIEDEDIRLNRVGIFYKPYLAPRADRGWRFMREGRAGRAPAALSDEQMEQFARVFGPTMKALGYVVAASN